MTIIGLIISICALNLGIAMKEITSVPIDILIEKYDISTSISLTEAILIGIMPIGAVFGTLINVKMLKHVRRVSSLYIFAAVNVGAIVLVNVNHYPSLVVGRFI